MCVFFGNVEIRIFFPSLRKSSVVVLSAIFEMTSRSFFFYGVKAQRFETKTHVAMEFLDATVFHDIKAESKSIF